MTTGPDPQARFVPGTRTALARGDLWVLIDRPLGDAFAQRVWTAVNDGVSSDDLLDTLLSPGLRAAPAFAVAATTPGGMRFLVRGDFTVTGEGSDGPISVVGQSICADVVVIGVDRCVLRAGESDGMPVAPLIVGMVPADGVEIDLTGHDLESTPIETVASLPAPLEDTVDDDVPADDNPGSDPVVPGVAAPTAQEPAVEVEDAESLAAIREYERLFGAPGEPEEVSDPAATADQAGTASEGSIGDVDAPTRASEAATVVDDTPSRSVAEAPWSSDVPAVVHDTPTVAAFPAEPAPTPATGIIEELPDFFGPLGGANPPRPVQPAPTVAAPTVAAPTNPPTAAGSVAASASAPSAGTPPSPATPVQGRTVNRSQLAAAASSTGPMVWAARCPVGHPSQAFAATCRVCGQTIAPQEPQEIARPVLGRLVVPGAAPIPLDGDLVLGRDPHVPPGASVPLPRLVVLNDPRLEVSSQHASITLNFWDVCLTDLGSTNGTEIITPDGRRQRLAQNTPVTIAPRTRIVLAEVLELLFEATA